ncbi:MAG: OmpH family outer membrane protein [Planctomycetes bacterium]|nr:OmpH family outer membrane protein [Planctomycetota bacterium]
MKRLAAGLFVLSLFSVIVGLYYQNNSSQIGIINLNECWEKYEKVKKIKSELESNDKLYEAELSRLKKLVDEAAEKISAAPPGTSLRFDKVEEYQMLGYQLNLKKEKFTQERAARINRYKEEIYTEIAQVAEVVAKERGVKLLLKGELPWEEDVKDTPGKLLEFKVLYRIVMYYDKALDITEDVLKKLNTKQ